MMSVLARFPVRQSSLRTQVLDGVSNPPSSLWYRSRKSSEDFLTLSSLAVIPRSERTISFQMVA
jgi:hypothetical protein